jgi:hypothetical protein
MREKEMQSIHAYGLLFSFPPPSLFVLLGSFVGHSRVICKVPQLGAKTGQFRHNKASNM